MWQWGDKLVHVTNMYKMFYGALAFNQPLDQWDISNVTDMSYIFEGAVNFNQSLKSWDCL